MILALTIPAVAATNNGNGNNKIINEYVAGAELKQDFNNAQFHCNTFGGNGRVWPVIPADMKKFDGKLTFTKADGTRWDLSAVEDKNGIGLEMVVCPECGSTAWITFSNNSGVPDGKNIQMQHPGENIIIIKEWIKHNAPYPDGFKFSANFGITLSSGKIYKAGPGKYFLPEDLTATVEEISCSKGFELVKFELNGVEQELAAIEGVKGGDTVKATNEDEDNSGYDGILNLLKTVEGTLIADWELNDIGILDVFGDMFFNLYKANVDSNGNPVGYDDSEVIASAELDISGTISFNFESEEALNGWYAVVEFFTPGSKAEEIFEDAEPLYVFFVDGVGIGGAKTDFDYDAFYTIVNGHGSGYVLGYPGLNNSGDIFPIAIQTGDKVYPSFCANAGSHYFAGQGGMDCAGYYVSMNGVPNGVPYGDFIKAYNYIEVKYGKLNDYRAVTQIVTWAILGAIDIESEAFADINWTAVEAGTGTVKGIPGAKLIVEDVMANYMSFVFSGDEEIVDVVFLVCDKHNDGEGHDFVNCQPQLVPVYGSSGFDNRIKTGYDGSVWFNKVKYGGMLPVGFEEFFFELFEIVDGVETKIGVYGTDVLGCVLVEKLLPGSYVFREVLSADLTFAGMAFEVSYRPVWKAIYPDGDNGLYFTIPETGGDAVWKDGYELDYTGAPTVDNVYYCKHAYLWTVTKETEDSIPFGDGWIRFDLGHDHTYEATYRNANCYDGAGWLMQCAVCGPVSGGFYIADEANPATGHNFSFDPVHPVWCTAATAGTIYRRCGNEGCGYSDQIMDYALWYQLLLDVDIDPADYGFLQ